jgi:hypothetical protein
MEGEDVLMKETAAALVWREILMVLGYEFLSLFDEGTRGIHGLTETGGVVKTEIVSR